MTDHHHDETEPRGDGWADRAEPDEATVDTLGVVLRSAAIWEDPDPDVEQAVLATISSEAGHVEPLMPGRPGRGDRRSLWLIGAVAVLLLAAGVAIGLLVGDDDTMEVALDGTELAPGASASARLEDTSQGLRIELEVTGLPPAAPGTYYQAWVRSERDEVSAGTFHLRGGDGSIELWAGVSSDGHPLVTVTLQTEGGGAETSGKVVLRGRVE